jgi:hypothetical protein
MTSIVQIDDKLISADVFEKCFACDIAQCAGICCVLGDSGAPLEKKEKRILQREYEHFAACMKPEGRRAVEQQGYAVIDLDGDLVTPLIDGAACAYSNTDAAGTCYCAIERAFLDGKTTFRKPISCYIYPVRIKQVGEFTCLNYDVWSACDSARTKGKEKNIPVFRFLQQPIIARFGQAFYEKMQALSEELNIS